MNENASIKYSEDEVSAQSAAPHGVLPEEKENEAGTSEDSIALAKILAGVFGFFLVVIIPVGMMMEDGGGILTKTEDSLANQPVISGPTNATSVQLGYSYGQNIPSPQPQKLESTPSENVSGLPEENMQSLVLQTSQMVKELAVSCRRNNGIIQSGFGGQLLCNNEVAQSDARSRILWPMVSVCGPNPTDTTWTVFRGDTDTWDITIHCALREECNGPLNALCTKNGCTFSDACLPS